MKPIEGQEFRPKGSDGDYYNIARDVTAQFPRYLDAAAGGLDKAAAGTACASARAAAGITDEVLAEAILRLHNAYDLGVAVTGEDMLPDPTIVPDVALDRAEFLKLPWLAQEMVFSALGQVVFSEAFIGRRTRSAPGHLPTQTLGLRASREMVRRILARLRGSASELPELGVAEVATRETLQETMQLLDKANRRVQRLEIALKTALSPRIRAWSWVRAVWKMFTFKKK